MGEVTVRNAGDLVAMRIEPIVRNALAALRADFPVEIRVIGYTFSEGRWRGQAFYVEGEAIIGLPRSLLNETDMSLALTLYEEVAHCSLEVAGVRAGVAWREGWQAPVVTPGGFIHETFAK